MKTSGGYSHVAAERRLQAELGLVTTPSTMPIRSRPISLPRSRPIRAWKASMSANSCFGRVVGGLAELGQAEAAAPALAQLAAELRSSAARWVLSVDGDRLSSDLRIGEAVGFDQGHEYAQQAQIDIVEASHGRGLASIH